MNRMLVALVCAGAIGTTALCGEGKVNDELARLRGEVAALRKQVEKLVAQKDETRVLFAKLLVLARKLKAGEKLEDGSEDLAALQRCLRLGGALSSRAMGLMDKLPKSQRCNLLAGVVKDPAIHYLTRKAAVTELVALGGDEARKAIHEAIEQEMLLPAGKSLGGYSRYYDVKPNLAIAAGDLKDGVAVDFSLVCLRSLAASARSAIASKKAGGHHGYGAYISGVNKTLIVRLKAWSGLEVFDQFLAKQEGRWGQMGYYRLNTEERAKALEDALAKTAEWWKTGKKEFKFPDKIEPAAVDNPPARTKTRPVERF